MRVHPLVPTVAFALFAACSPLHADEVDALGPEASGEFQGPEHRAGQPCLVCHSGHGPGSSNFSVAGTVFRTADARVGLEGAEVLLTGADNATYRASTNRVGTFYVPNATWVPVYPMRVEISFGGVTTKMSSHVGREGACAICHLDPPSASLAGHVYLVPDAASFPK